MSTKVFSNPDGTNFPEGGTEIGWSVQGNAAYVHVYNPVFRRPDHTNTPPSNWTVQNTSTGSDQNTVQNAGV